MLTETPCTALLMDQQMVSQHSNMINNFWQAQLQLIEQGDLDFKNYQLPLARIKKVMKTDDDVKPMVKTSDFRMSNYVCR